MILLKSDPQQDFQDIAAIVYFPFTVGIFNFRRNIKYTIIESSEDVQFYQIDKDDRQNLQVSVIHNLDSKGRIIGWNSGNGSKQSTLQIPTQIQINPKSCLNSEELIVVTWDTSSVLVSQEEDFIIVIGESNLFQVWSIEQNMLVYQADFQKIYCDQRDANSTSVDSLINFTFGSINQKNQISAVSENYIFVFSLEEKSPQLFKNQVLKLRTFKWMQAFVVDNLVVVGQEYSVSTLDLNTSKFNYFMDSFDQAQSSYDVAVQIQIDSDFNRIIKLDKAGIIQYWSLFDNLLEKQINYTTYYSTFFIDKSINKLNLNLKIRKEGSNTQIFFFDEYLNRLFVGCLLPGTIVVWDLSKNFQLIQVLDQIEFSDRITGIAFNPQAQLIMFLGWDWWSRSIDYYTLNHRCWIEGLFGNFDYTNKLQILWDQNGYVRIYDYNCVQLGYIIAHQNWIYQCLVDEQNLILTTVRYQIQLQNQLYDAFLDKDNNYVFVSDFNGFIYVLTYPQLVLVKQMQVTNSIINKLYFDSQHNMLMFGSLGSNTVGYYNLIQFIQSNAYTLSYTYVGVMSTLQTQQGIIFYQEGNIVQLWDYKSKQLRYGFYAADLYIDAQSEFILIKGQTSIAALLTCEQTVFFDINTLSIIKVQKQKFFRKTQIQGYLICSYVNNITILDVNAYIIFQQISIDKNSSIVELKAIVPLKTFFVTTTQGQIIGYTLNLSSQHQQFNQIFNLQLLNEAIVNSLVIEQSTSYILIAPTLNGQIAQMVLSQELAILKQQTLLLPGISSHAHILQYTNGYQSFIYLIHDFSLNLLNPYDLVLVGQVTSPCIGYSYKLDINLDLDYIIQSCLGIYQINELSTLQLVSQGRFTYTLLQNPLNPIFTPVDNRIIFINKDYFFDVYTYQIQTYKINRLDQTISLQGIYSQDQQMLGKVADYEIFDTKENVYAKLILFSGFQIAQIQLPVFGQSICQENITSDQFASVLQYIQIERETILPPFPPFQFSNHSQVYIISKKNTTQYKIIATEDLLTSFSGYDLASLNNLQIQPAISQKDYIQFLIQDIQTFEMNNIQLQYSVLQIICQTLKITNFIISQNSDFTNQNTLVSIKTFSDFDFDKFVANLNKGFNNIAIIQNQNQGTLQNTEITNNDATQVLMITQSILQILNLKLLHNQSNGFNQLNSIVNIDQKSLVSIKYSTFKNNIANQGGSIFLSQSELQIEGSSFDSNQGLQQGGSIYSQFSNLKINNSQFLNSKSSNGGTFSDGGVLYITQSNGNNSYIVNSIFQNSQALGSGGVILVYGSDIIISNSNFINNAAGIGGVI
ncbi:hypothetical protein TTHERM_000566849 (macronuclear) [Tetrahymena thermophila SB210]|uniref:Transmembrane protein n=1 Tax=Tetrahymena thermophila (strain SB210) TaxID=312017 RepID=W7X612_TETTS|nr:hypothetical protein TTHERM_000566849 [Tetrahymena thermophila SB210]EWS72827.1 hypothetical protein TTHERM_000566849 [Tetrahymena thermophila SB210]|eukprot:XP_012654653.1 hypothetical protein TTHERM_000566849 [Tetrahymena thermophila SB210]